MTSTQELRVGDRVIDPYLRKGRQGKITEIDKSRLTMGDRTGSKFFRMDFRSQPSVSTTK